MRPVLSEKQAGRQAGCSSIYSAVPSPHEGTSYNPPVTSHEELLRAAIEKEKRRVKEANELAKTKEKIEQARKAGADEAMEGVPPGMTVQPVVDDDDGGDVGAEEALPARRIPERKTKKERRKAEKLRAEV